MIRVPVSSTELVVMILLAIVLPSSLRARTPPSLDSATTPDLSGTFQLVSLGTKLPGGLKGTGSPDTISLLPDAAAKAKSRNLKEDPANMCQAIGPFRM